MGIALFSQVLCLHVKLELVISKPCANKCLKYVLISLICIYRLSGENAVYCRACGGNRVKLVRTNKRREGKTGIDCKGEATL